ncbi:7223_t:CDS:2, partial [Acaulospora colombiana]
FELSPMSDTATLHYFVSSTPAPVTKVLLEKFCRAKFPFALWLMFAKPVMFRYALLPILILGPLMVPYIPQRFKTTKKQATTEDALTTSLSNLDAIHALRPDISFDDLVPATLTPQERLRMLGMLLPVYITLTFWIPFRVLVAITGAMLLTYRAPWAVTTRRILFRSAYVRAAWRYVVSWLSGTQPLPIFLSKPSPSGKDAVKAADKGLAKSTSHAFLFTILENQRWWVASTTKNPNPQGQQQQQQFVPVPPPATFPLPPTTSVVLPSSTGKGFVRRTARWEWEENSEWEVIVHKEGDTVKKMRATVKSPTEEAKSGILGKNADKLTLTQSPTNSSFHHPEDPSHPPGSQSSGTGGDHEFTDQEGWIYGDNKWENPAGKGGMGKPAKGAQRENTSQDTQVQTQPPTIASPTKSEPKGSPERSRGRSADGRSNELPSAETSLQQRLKAALKTQT